VSRPHRRLGELLSLVQTCLLILVLLFVLGGLDAWVGP
jgi:hypothetical protein